MTAAVAGCTVTFLPGNGEWALKAHYITTRHLTPPQTNSLFLTPPNEAQRAMRVQGRRGGWVNEKCEKLHTKRSEMRLSGPAGRAQMCPTNDLVGSRFRAEV